MVEPANFSNEAVDGLLVDWLTKLHPLSVRAIVVLAPSIKEGPANAVLAVYPPRHLPVAQSVARDGFIESVTQSAGYSLVSWQELAGHMQTADISDGAQQWSDLGMGGLLRVSFETVASRSFHCLLLCAAGRLEPAVQGALVWSVLSMWPKVKSALLKTRALLSVREVQCLELAFKGFTAAETATALGCGERTVNFHLSNAMAKLSARNKLEAIQRACWLGIL